MRPIEDFGPKAMYTRQGILCPRDDAERTAFVRAFVREGDEVVLVYDTRAGVTRDLSRGWAPVVELRRARLGVRGAGGRVRAIHVRAVYRVRRPVVTGAPPIRGPRATQLPLFEVLGRARA